jgi:hypothetical protein
VCKHIYTQSTIAVSLIFISEILSNAKKEKAQQTRRGPFNAIHVYNVVHNTLLYGAPCYEGVLESGDIELPVLDAGGWSASCPGCFTPRQPCTNWTGGWMGPRASLDTVKNRKISCPHQVSNPNFSAI